MARRKQDCSSPNLRPLHNFGVVLSHLYMQQRELDEGKRASKTTE